MQVYLRNENDFETEMPYDYEHMMSSLIWVFLSVSIAMKVMWLLVNVSLRVPWLDEWVVFLDLTCFADGSTCWNMVNWWTINDDQVEIVVTKYAFFLLEYTRWWIGMYINIRSDLTEKETEPGTYVMMLIQCFCPRILMVLSE